MAIKMDFDWVLLLWVALLDWEKAWMMGKALVFLWLAN